MRIKIIFSAMIIFALSLLSCVTFAATNGNPKVFGYLSVGVTKVEKKTDIDGTAFEASLGVKGAYKKESLILRYKLEAELTNAVNNAKGMADLEVKNALIALPTKYGTFVISSRAESGQQREVYKPIDIFEVNEADNSTLWFQPDEASSIFAYVTPRYKNTHITMSVLTLNSTRNGSINHNGKDADAMSLRVIHNGEKVYLAAGLVSVSDKQLPTTRTYYRSSLGAGYRFDDLKLGAVWEHNEHHPAGNSDVVGVTADYRIDEKWSIGVGYTDRNADKRSLNDNETSFIARYQLFKNVFAFAEIADYDVSNNNYSLGIKIKY